MKNRLLEGFWWHVKHRSDATALIINDKRIFYGNLGESALLIAHELRSLGVNCEDRVVILAERHPLLYASVFGVCNLNASLSVIRTSDPISRREKILQILAPRAVIYVEETQSSLELEESFKCKKVIHTQYGNLKLFVNFNAQSVYWDEAYIITTSGSTGRPKFVSISSHSLEHFLTFIIKKIDVKTNDILTQTFEPTFDLFFFDIFVGLNNGATLLVIKSTETWTALDLCEKYNATIWFSVPSLAFILMQAGKLTKYRESRLRLTLFCGEPLQSSLVMAWHNSYPNTVIKNLYGPSELTIACTHFTVNSQHLAEATIIPIGWLNDDLTAVVRTDNGKFSEFGYGELCIAGKQLMNGYLTEFGDIDNESFISYKGQMFYCTGDLVEIIPNFPIDYRGRVDRQIKRLGYRVQPEEIEAIMTSIEGVVEAVIVPIYSVRTSIEFIIGLKAIWVAQNHLDEKAKFFVEKSIKNKLNQTLPRYMIPGFLVCVDSLPRNKNGKINLTAFKE